MAASDIDRLIEMGLSRYGAGDLDGAMLLWEEALAVDPANAQANSYVDYVRQNYELLSSNADPEVAAEDVARFAIEEEPEYLIEILPGEQLPQAVAKNIDPLDEGWSMDEETLETGAVPEAQRFSDQLRRLELDTDEPIPPPPPEINFEDATREYHGQPAQPAPAVRSLDVSLTDPSAEFQDEATGGFGSEGTPVGFSTQETEVRKRDLGFVQPAPTPVKDTPSSRLSVGTASTVELAAALREQTAGDDNPSGASPSENPFGTLELDPNEGGDDLISSLPTPRPVAEVTTRDLPRHKSSTRDLPPTSRAPAHRDSEAFSQAEVMMTHAPTQDFVDQRVKVDIGAPTRELGLRGNAPPANTDDELTKQTNLRAMRQMPTRAQGTARPATATSPTEGTRHDIVLPFDPIDARAAQVLDDVDETATPNESHEDRTRRRITGLLERAAAYSSQQDLDKAVTAVDLALSEDPNSALGQKLITRNRDTIMHVFQAFLGDLERMPQLARPLHELSNAPISPRAAFLLSRIDGTLTIDELLDVSGMPKLEAYRHLCQLFLRGILR